MKKLIILLAVLFLVSCAPSVTEAPVQTAQAEMTASGKISAEDLFAIMEKTKVQVIDVRTPEEYAAGHLEGAINIPVDDILKDPAVVTVAKDQPIAVYCRTGVRSGEAFKALQQAGFETIYDIPGVAMYQYDLVQ